ncbi:MAG: hypothetical protein JW751_11495 [Polyangiaceae bacterium]|nr:hypothetical protein [Polyangiaceae bacterium]
MSANARATPRGLLLAIATVLTVEAPALGQQPDDTTTRAARELGNEGIELYDQGEFAAALDRLQRAYGVIKVPSLGLWYARSLARNGQLVEASERYLEVARSHPQPDEPGVFAESRREASDENQALQARIPSVRVVLEGASPQEVNVSIDGKPLAAMLMGVPISLNPGARQVTARRGTETVTQTVALREGESQNVVLVFTAQPSTTAADTDPVAASPEADDRGASRGGTSRRTWAYVAFGVGGAGLITGTIAHALAKGKESDLDRVCDHELCPTDAQRDIDTYDTLKTVAPAGVVLGIAGVGAGAVLLFTAPHDKPRSGRVAPYLGVGSAGLKGVF